MNIETLLVNAVITVATVAAAIKFILFEWEGIIAAWHRVSATKEDQEK
jgi:hypothetical protein